MPTGTHLLNAREMLFEAAERLLRRDGPAGLTSRAVTDEAGVAKGVLHHHFADFDTFLAELIIDRAARLDAAVAGTPGTGNVVDNLAAAMRAIFTPLGVAMVALVITRDGLRRRLREAGAPRFPLIAEGTAIVAAYLAEEQALGRLGAKADAPGLAHVLIGSAHLLFTDREGGPPSREAVHKVVATVMQGAV